MTETIEFCEEWFERETGEGGEARIKCAAARPLPFYDRRTIREFAASRVKEVDRRQAELECRRFASTVAFCDLTDLRPLRTARCLQKHMKELEPLFDHAAFWATRSGTGKQYLVTVEPYKRWENFDYLATPSGWRCAALPPGVGFHDPDRLDRGTRLVLCPPPYRGVDIDEMLERLKAMPMWEDFNPVVSIMRKAGASRAAMRL